MDGGQHSEFTVGDGAPLPSPAPPERAGVRLRTARHDTATNPKPQPRPFHYSCERTVPLGQIADRLPPTVACTLSASARRMPVIAIKLTSLAGATLHAGPTLTEAALYLDHRDLSALEAGAIVPELAEVIARVR